MPALDDPDGRLGNYNVTINNGTLKVTYAVCAQYNQTQGNQRGSTIPIKIQLCDVNGTNVSSSSVTVHAESIVRLPDGTPQPPQAAGNSNPNNDFQYQSMLGMTSGYSYNLSTKGLASGTYTLQFSASGDPLPHTVLFTVR